MPRGKILAGRLPAPGFRRPLPPQGNTGETTFLSPNATGKRLLIFDLDGTLIDSLDDLHAAVNHLRRQFGLAPVGSPQTRAFVGDGLRLLVQRALAEAAPGREELERGCDVFRSYYAAHLLGRTALYPGVRETLPQLARAWHLAVVTNKPQPQAEQLCRGLGLEPWLMLLVGGDAARPLKPQPDGLLLACSQAGCQPEKAWMIGDHYTDLAAARAAGMPGCFCRYGFGEARDELSACQIESFRQLPEVLF